jgi:hypothetical protein
MIFSKRQLAELFDSVCSQLTQRKYVKERMGFFADFYNKIDGYICFPLPIEKDTAENYRNRLVKAGFKIQVMTSRRRLASGTLQR